MHEPRYPDAVFIPPKPEEANPMCVCAKCSRLLPAQYFERKLTKAQMKARGYAGKTCLTIQSSLCAGCRPKGTSLIKKTPTQIQHLAYSGEITQNHADTLIDLKAQRRKENHSTAARKRWVRTSFQPLMDVMQAENLWVHRLRSTSKAFLEKENISDSPDPHVIARHTAVLAFADAYHAILRDVSLNIRAHRLQLTNMEKGKKNAQADDRPYAHIRLYANESDVVGLQQLWVQLLERQCTEPHPRIKPLRKDVAIFNEDV